jgi:hypothetical protein
MSITAPTDIAGCALYLDADQITGKSEGDAITTWSDLSGAAHHATQATTAKKPVYKDNVWNGHSAVRFDGSANNKQLVSTFSDNETITVFAVLAKLTDPDYFSQTAFALGGTADGSMKLGWNAGIGAGYIWYPDQSFGVVDLSGTPTEVQVVALRSNASAVSVDTWINGSPSTAFQPRASIGTFSRFELGSTSDTGDEQPGDLDLYEFLVYTAALTNPQVADVIAYLTDKWLTVPAAPITIDNGFMMKASGTFTHQNLLLRANGSFIEFPSVAVRSAGSFS